MGLTQKDLAHRMGVCLNAPLPVRSKGIQDLSGEHMARLADVPAGSADDLLGRINDL